MLIFIFVFLNCFFPSLLQAQDLFSPHLGANNIYYFSTNEESGLKIDETGVVLMGGENEHTYTPEFKWDGERRVLEVRNLQIGDRADPPDLHLVRYNTTTGGRYDGYETAVHRGDSLGSVYWDGGGGEVGSVIDRNGASIYSKAMSTFTRESSPASLNFATTYPNKVVAKRRMYISQYGGLILDPNEDNICSNVQSEMNSNNFGFCIEGNKLYAISYNRKSLLLSNE